VRITLKDMCQELDMSLSIERYERGAYNTRWDLDCLWINVSCWDVGLSRRRSEGQLRTYGRDLLKARSRVGMACATPVIQ
jgi:hypothetical protein